MSPSPPIDAAAGPLCRRGPVRPARRRASDAGAGALLHRLAMAADVVEVPPPPIWPWSRRRSCCCSTPRSLIERVHRALRPAHPQRQVHLRPAAGASICSTRAASIGPFVYGYSYRLDMETLKRDVHAGPDQGAAAALLLPRRRLPASGASARATSISSARPRAAPCSCWAPTGSGATCSRASSTARASRSPSACSASRSASSSASSWAASRAITAAGSTTSSSA